MVEQIKWVERKFNFDFPVGLFPNFVERLRGTPARLEEIANSVSPENLTKQINNDWSIQEHIGHLMDLDELHENRLDEFLVNVETLSPADMQNHKTYEANHNDADAREMLSAFRSKRLNFVMRLDDLDAETAARTALHPRLKQPMRLIDMVYFAAEYDDHHIATMTLLSRLPSL